MIVSRSVDFFEGSSGFDCPEAWAWLKDIDPELLWNPISSEEEKEEEFDSTSSLESNVENTTQAVMVPQQPAKPTLKNVSIVVPVIPRNWKQSKENSGLNTGNKRAEKHSDDIAFNRAGKIDENHAVGVDDSMSDSASSYSDADDEDDHELEGESDDANDPAHDHYSDSNSEEEKELIEKKNQLSLKIV